MVMVRNTYFMMMLKCLLFRYTDSSTSQGVSIQVPASPHTVVVARAGVVGVALQQVVGGCADEAYLAGERRKGPAG